MTSTKVMKGVHQNGIWIICAWDDCDAQGYELHKIVIHEHVGSPCDDPYSEHINFLFCSERHKMYHVNSHKNYGKLPAGYNKY